MTGERRCSGDRRRTAPPLGETRRATGAVPHGQAPSQGAATGAHGARQREACRCRRTPEGSVGAGMAAPQGVVATRGPAARGGEEGAGSHRRRRAAWARPSEVSPARRGAPSAGACGRNDGRVASRGGGPDPVARTSRKAGADARQARHVPSRRRAVRGAPRTATTAGSPAAVPAATTDLGPDSTSVVRMAPGDGVSPSDSEDVTTPRGNPHGGRVDGIGNADVRQERAAHDAAQGERIREGAKRRPRGRLPTGARQGGGRPARPEGPIRRITRRRPVTRARARRRH